MWFRQTYILTNTECWIWEINQIINMHIHTERVYKLTPCPKHSKLFWLVGHLVWSMCGYMLTHVWFTHTKFSPQGVPSLTSPCSGYSEAIWVPLVALYAKIQLLFVFSPMCAANTYLHSYSTPLIDMIVLEFNWSIPSTDGCRSPSLHCSDPHTTLLHKKIIQVHVNKRMCVK